MMNMIKLLKELQMTKLMLNIYFIIIVYINMEKFIICANIILVSLITYTIYKIYFLKEGAKGCDASAGENDAKNKADSSIASLSARIASAEKSASAAKVAVESQRKELEKIKADLEKQVNENKEKMKNG
jgi:hypothetical protein